MADIARVKTWSEADAEILFPSDLNGEFNNVIAGANSNFAEIAAEIAAAINALNIHKTYTGAHINIRDWYYGAELPTEGSYRFCYITSGADAGKIYLRKNSVDGNPGEWVLWLTEAHPALDARDGGTFRAAEAVTADAVVEGGITNNQFANTDDIVPPYSSNNTDGWLNCSISYDQITGAFFYNFLSTSTDFQSGSSTKYIPSGTDMAKLVDIRITKGGTWFFRVRATGNASSKAFVAIYRRRDGQATMVSDVLEFPASVSQGPNSTKVVSVAGWEANDYAEIWGRVISGTGQFINFSVGCINPFSPNIISI